MPTTETFLRIADVEAATALDRSTIYRKVTAGEFPEPIQLSPGGRAVAWKQSEVSAWIEERATKGREAWRANRPKARAMAKARRAGVRGAQP